MSGPDPVFHTKLSAAEAAQRAQELLANPLLDEIFAELDTAAVVVWRRSTSAYQREEQWNIVVTLAAVRRQIESRIEAVRLATSREQTARRDTR